MKRLSLTCAAAAALAALAPAATPAADWAGARQRQSVSWDELGRTRWIADGRDDAPRKVYVFMDANCKYCTKFWSDARPWVDGGKVQLRHVMVGVISPDSPGKAAALLADPDPAKRLAAYERAHAFAIVRMMAGGPRHSLQDPALAPMATIPAPLAREIADHERMMRALGLQGTPGIVTLGLGGVPVARPGLSPEDMAAVLGPL